MKNTTNLASQKNFDLRVAGRRTNLPAGRQECVPACADKPDEDVG
tara:strand:- start:270983 stop:271117 length:135 start_codon:yes stop_codon:yes gene_type:complete